MTDSMTKKTRKSPKERSSRTRTQRDARKMARNKRPRDVKNRELAKRWIPTITYIFHPLLFKPSTIRNKLSHVILFIAYLFSHSIIDEELAKKRGHVELIIVKFSGLKLLFALRDWLLIIAVCGYTPQTLRNCAESVYTVLTYLVPSVSQRAHVWRHVWRNCVRTCENNAPAQAPPVSRIVFAKLSEHSKLLGLLLLATSWRLHSLRSAVQILKRSFSPACSSRYWVVMVSAVKFLPMQGGLCRRVYCNCSTEHGSKCCFLHQYTRASELRIISDDCPLISRGALSRFKSEVSRFGIREHSWHVTSALNCAFVKNYFPLDIPIFNRWNNWNGDSSLIYKRYARYVEEFDAELIVPLDISLIAFCVDLMYE